MRQFAYVGEDGQIRLRDLDAETDFPISATGGPEGTPTMVCSWPTWSVDGKRLGYVRYELEGGRVSAATVQVARSDGSHEAEVYRTRGGMPIYMSWAPNGERLGLLVQEDQQLSLEIVDASGLRSPFSVARGAPLYFCWHGGSGGLLAHVGRGVDASQGGRLIWIRLEGSPFVTEPLSEAPARGFRCPAWASRLQGMAVAFERDGEAQIALSPGADTSPESLFLCPGAPALVWSPSGERLAFAGRSPDDNGLYQGIGVFRVADRTTDQVTDARVLAFFWAPDSRRLVHVGGLTGDRTVRLGVVDVETKEQKDLGLVRPSRDVLMLFGHFDQYAQSVQLFSSEGGELLLAASLAKEGENGSVPTVRQVLVRSLAREGAARVVARGRVAFWRPGV